MIRLVLEIEMAGAWPESPLEVVEKYVLSPQLLRISKGEEKPKYVHNENAGDRVPLLTVTIVSGKQLPPKLSSSSKKR